MNNPEAGLNTSPQPAITIVIPTLNEGFSIGATLSALEGVPEIEIIVVDGGSCDQTREEAAARGAKVLEVRPGKAGQMNTGAREATAPILLFLHADTLLPRNFQPLIKQAFADPTVAISAFRFSTDGDSAGIHWVERFANLRSKWLGMPYGDQGLAIRKDIFLKVGGFPDLPIMEDYELVRRLRRCGRLVILPAFAVTSSRRWENLGVIRTTLTNWLIVLGFHAGISPARLVSWYSRQKGVYRSEKKK